MMYQVTANKNTVIGNMANKVSMNMHDVNMYTFCTYRYTSVFLSIHICVSISFCVRSLSLYLYIYTYISIRMVSYDCTYGSIGLHSYVEVAL